MVWEVRQACMATTCNTQPIAPVVREGGGPQRPANGTRWGVASTSIVGSDGEQHMVGRGEAPWHQAAIAGGYRHGMQAGEKAGRPARMGSLATPSILPNPLPPPRTAQYCHMRLPDGCCLVPVTLSFLCHQILPACCPLSLPQLPHVTSPSFLPLPPPTGFAATPPSQRLVSRLEEALMPAAR